MTAGGYYGAQAQSFHPLHGAPTTDSGGGVIYFDSGKELDSILSAFQLMGAAFWMQDRGYAVFVTESDDPKRDGFLAHCRVIPFGALQPIFGANLELVESVPGAQSITVTDFLAGLISIQQERYGTSMSPALYGCMGGDGDWAKEELCFGFMLENQNHQIFRIWSRAWLVTK